MEIVQTPIPNSPKPVLTPFSTPQPSPVIPTFDDISSYAKQKYELENPYTKYKDLYTATAVTPLDLAKRYNDPEFGFSPFNPNIEQDYADRQSTNEIAWRNVAQGSRRFLATALGGFADIPDTFEAVSGEGWNAFNNTEWKNSLIDWADAYTEENPIYNSAAIESANPIGSWFNPLDWKTFVTKWSTLANNLGFTFGAITNAVATDALLAATTGYGETLLLPKQAKTISTAMWNLGKSFEAGKSAANLQKILSAPKQILNEINSIAKTSSRLNSTRFGLSLYNSAVGEGSVEGYNNYKQTKQELINNHIDNFGVAPDTATLNEIEKTARESGATTTLANTALLLATNYVTFGRILNPTSAALRTAEKEAIQKGVTRVAGNLDDVIVATNANSKLSKFVKSLKPTLTTMASEGFEEGAQYNIEQSTRDYYLAKYRGSDDAEQLWKSFTKGIAETIGTREGLDNIIMGALSGAVIHGTNNITSRARSAIRGEKYISSENKAIQNAVAVANSSAGLTGSIRDLHNESSTQMDVLKRMNEAIENNDIEAAKNLKSDLLFSWVHTANKSGLIQLRLDALNDAKNLTDEDFTNFWGIDYSESAAKTAKNYLDLVEKKVLEYKNISDSIEIAFGKNPFNPRKNSLNYQAFEDYKEALAHSLVQIKDSESRISSLSNSVNKVFPNAPIDNLVDLTNREGLENTVNNLKNKIKFLNSVQNDTDTMALFPKKIDNEKKFLEKQLNSLQSFLDGNNDNEDEFKETFLNLSEYYNNPSSIGADNSFNSIGKDNLFNELSAIAILRKRALLASKYYETLRNKKGFDSVLSSVTDAVRGTFTKRLSLKDGKYTIRTAEDIQKEQFEKLQSTLKDLEDAKEKEVQRQLNEQMPEDEIDDITAAQGNLIDDALNKIQEGRENELTDEEREAIQLAPKVVERKKLEAEIRKKVEGISQQTPTEEKPKELSSIDNLLGNIFIMDNENSPGYEDFKKEKTIVETTRTISPTYTKYVLNSPIFKFIFGDKLNISSAHIVVRDTKGKPENTEPTKIGGTKLYRSRNTNEAVLYINGSPMGFISNSNNLYIEKDGKLEKVNTILKSLTKEDLGYTEDEFKEFKTKFAAYDSMSNKIFSLYKKGEEVTIPQETVTSLMAIQPNVLGFKATYQETDSTLLKDIKALGENSYIISVKNVFQKQPNGEYAPQRVINVIGKDGILNDEAIANEPELSKIMSNEKFIKTLIANNSRYSLLNRLPNGKFSPTISRVVARPIKLNDAENDQFFTDLKNDNTDGILGYLENLYITDSTRTKGSGIKVEFLVDPKGEIYLTVVDKNKNLLMAEMNISTFSKDTEDLDELISDINDELATQMDDPLVIKREDFKKLIDDDNAVKFDSFMNSLAVSTTPYFFNQIKLTAIPRESLPQITQSLTTSSQNNITNNLLKSEKITIFATEFDPNDIEGIAKARSIQYYMDDIVAQLKKNNTIQETKCN